MTTDWELVVGLEVPVERSETINTVSCSAAGRFWSVGAAAQPQSLGGQP